MDMFKDSSNEIFTVSFGIDRTDEKEIRDYIESFDFLSNVKFSDLGFVADLKYEDIKVVSGKLVEKGITIYSIMRKGSNK